MDKIQTIKKNHSKPISILLADDHPLLRAGFTKLLTDSGLIEVIAECSDAKEAYDKYVEIKPDVVVLDILFKEKMTGIDTLKDILDYDSDAVILMLTQHDQPRVIKEAYQLGAKSFIPKDAEPDLLIKAIEHVANGEVYFLPEVAQKLAALSTINHNLPQDILSKREFSVYKLIAEDNSLSEIAKILGISIKSVGNALHTVRKKLGITRNTEIIKHAIKNEVIHLED